MFKKASFQGAFRLTNIEFLAFASGGLALTKNYIDWANNVFLFYFVLGRDKDLSQRTS